MWAIIGKLATAYVLCRLLISLLKGLYSCFIAHAFQLSLNINKTGKWAVVTGATDGIGKAYAFELARHGLNIVLISRTTTKLQAVATEIKEKYPVETKCITADFTQTDIYEGIGRALQGLDIGVLVNNVGMGYDYPEYLTDLPQVEQFCTRLINMNVTSVTRMSLLVLPGMQERSRGVVINVSSLSAVVPTPFLTVYAATKAFVVNFSRNLALEVAQKGITVQCVVPGFVVSKLSKIRRESLTVPSPAAYVRQAVGTVGVEGVTGGYLMHKLMIYAFGVLDMVLPASIIDKQMVAHMKTLRRKALNKKDREVKSK